MNLKKSIKKKNIWVIGDLMIDRYYFGNVKRISPEAPVPVFLKKGEKYIAGGAANVVANLIAAGQSVSVVSVIGQDILGEELQNILIKLGGNCKHLIHSENRCTSVKTRLLAQNNQQMLRIDEEQTNAISDDEEREIISTLEQNITKIDAIILSDYMKGVLTFNVCQTIIKIANANNVPVLVDVKDSNIEKYKNATVLKPNRNELQVATTMSVETESDISKAARVLLKNSNCKYVLATLGSEGMLLVGEKEEKWISSIQHEVFDVSGAGDTVISYLTTCFANDIEMHQAAIIANYAAGVKVTKLGTAPVSLEEVNDYILDNEDDDVIYKSSKKLLSKESLLEELKERKNKQIVFTNGCFDILHAGHVGYLRKAASFGDLLIVGLNSDASVKRLKGETRPINCELDRTEILCALEFVDYVVIFDEDTPLNLIKEIRPNILVKGADYKKEEVVGAEFVEKEGGRVELVPFLKDHSTTAIVNKM